MRTNQPFAAGEASTKNFKTAIHIKNMENSTGLPKKSPLKRLKNSIRIKSEEIFSSLQKEKETQTNMTSKVQEPKETITNTLGKNIVFLTDKKGNKKIKIHFSKKDTEKYPHLIGSFEIDENNHLSNDGYRKKGNLHIFKIEQLDSIVLFNKNGEVVNCLKNKTDFRTMRGRIFNTSKNKAEEKRKDTTSKFISTEYSLANTINSSKSFIGLLKLKRKKRRRQRDWKEQIIKGLGDTTVIYNNEGKKLGEFRYAEAQKLSKNKYTFLHKPDGTPIKIEITDSHIKTGKITLSNFPKVKESTECYIKKDEINNNYYLVDKKTNQLVSEIKESPEVLIVRKNTFRNKNTIIDTNGNELCEDYSNITFNERKNKFYKGKNWKMQELYNDYDKPSIRVLNKFIKSMNKILPDRRKVIDL